MRFRWMTSIWTLAVALAWRGVLFAQEAQSRFVPVKPGDLGQEHLSAANLVFAAYGFVWVALLVYVLLLWRRISRVEQELQALLAKAGARRP